MRNLPPFVDSFVLSFVESSVDKAKDKAIDKASKTRTETHTGPGSPPPALWSTKVLLALLLVLAQAALAQEPKIHLLPGEGWSNVFGGKESVFHFTVTSQAAFKGRLAWRFAASGRTLAAGDKDIAAEPAKPDTVEIRLAVPEVKEGVVFQTTLTLTAQEAKAEKPAASLEKTIWVFHESPFAGQKQALEKLKISLFDPEKKTAEIFEKVGIPHQPVQNPDALAEIKEGLLVVGEKVSWKDYRALGSLMAKTAARGIPVLCLAPGGGEMNVPGLGDTGELPRPSRIEFRGPSIIAEIDKRLDWESWPPDGRVMSRSLKVVGERGPVVATPMEGPSGWPWLELGYAGAQPRETRLVICTFALIEKWDSGPTPRHLLLRLLEYVGQEKQEREDSPRRHGDTEAR